MMSLKTSQVVTDTGLELDQSKRSAWNQEWKFTAKLGLTAAIIVLAANIGLLGYTLNNTKQKSDSISAVWTGPCDKAERVSIGTHLLINALSSALLTASNCGMQLVSAPTRELIDKAHAKRKWVDVGVQSMRNLRGMDWKRSTLWALLLLSSLPLHLLYNSAIVISKLEKRHVSVLVTEDFDKGHRWTDSISNEGCFSQFTLDDAVGGVQYLQDNYDDLVRLDPVECINAYNHNPMTDYANVLAVTDVPSSQNISVLNIWITKFYEPYPETWMCSTVEDHVPTLCDASSLAAAAAGGKWPLSGELVDSRSAPGVDRWADCEENRKSYNVQYCLAQPTPEACHIGVVTDTLAAVIASNAIKVICLAWICFWLRRRPLLTIGDAVASFLERPDPWTNNMGTLEAASHAKQENYDQVSKTWVGGRKRWFRAVRARRWVWSSILFMCVWLVCLILLVVGLGFNQANGYDKSANEILSNGLGRLNRQQMVGGFYILEIGVVGCSVLANVPQLAVSALYLLYNDLITRMYLCKEWTEFARHRRGLRVQHPTGEQRRAYLLTIPWIAASPLCILMIALHWLISQSIFFSHYIGQDYATGGATPNYWGPTVLGVGWSPLGLVLSLVVGGLLILGLWVMALIRSFPDGIPLVRTCSAAISAACHPGEWGAGEAEKPVQYGSMPGVFAPDGRPRASFSSGVVMPLTPGVVYG